MILISTEEPIIPAFTQFLIHNSRYLGVDEFEIQERIKDISKRNQSKNIIFEKMNKLGDNLKNLSLPNTGIFNRIGDNIL